MNDNVIRFIGGGIKCDNPECDFADETVRVEDLDRMWRDFEDYICTQTKITKARLQEVREKKLDWYIYSEESIGLGVATDFVDKF